MARTVRRLAPNQGTDFSLLKLVRGLSWDGQHLVRRGRPTESDTEAGENAAIWWIIVSWRESTLDPARMKHRKGRRK